MTACWVNRVYLWELTARRMQERGWSMRRTARELGISASTLSRIKQGKMVDADTLVTLLAWIEVDSTEVMLCEGVMG